MSRTFQTSDLDVGAFLMTQGLHYLGSRIEFDQVRRRPKAILEFDDSKQNARDLERVFMTSQEKRYREVLKYLLKEAHKAVAEYSREIIGGE